LETNIFIGAALNDGECIYNEAMPEISSISMMYFVPEKTEKALALSEYLFNLENSFLAVHESGMKHPTPP
jgi:hypothetical protein